MVVAMLLIAILAMSCGGRNPEPDYASVAEIFRPFYPGTQEVKATSDLDVYVDGSMSMRGYVATENSNYSRLIREVLQSATTAQFNLNVFKFTSTIRAVTHLPLGQLQSTGFYDGQDTPLAALLGRLAESPTHTAILITDMVQSEGGVDSLGLVKALARLAGQGPQMRLLAYRSNFAGDYYPEIRIAGSRQPAFRLNVSQSLPGTGRPFYLFVVAPNAESMSRLENYVLSRLPAVAEFNPTGPPISIENIGLDIATQRDRGWSLYSRPTRKETRWESAFLLKDRTSGASVTLPLWIQVQASIPLRDPGRLHIEALRSVWSGKGGLEEPTTAELPIDAQLDEESQRIRLRLTVRNPPRGSWDVYYIRLRSGEGNLGLPAWVPDWSTENDALAANGNRTFMLRLLVEAMVNAITERVVLCEWILRVGREH